MVLEGSDLIGGRKTLILLVVLELDSDLIGGIGRL